MTPAETDVGTLIVWIAGLLTVLNFGTAVWTVFSSPAKAAAARINEVTKRIEQVELRSQRIEDRLSQIPSLEALHELELSLTQTKGEIALLNERLRPIGAMTERLEEWMLRNGK